MKMKEKILKILSALLILPSVFIFFCGFSVVGSGKIKNSGKGSVKLEIQTQKEEASFKASLKERLKGYNVTSGDGDMLVLQDVKKNENGYEVLIDFRRIDKIKVKGGFYWQSFSSSVAEGSEFRALYEKWNKGNISCTVSAYYDGYLGRIDVPRSSLLKISPFYKDGTEMPIEQLLEKGERADKNETVFLFSLFDMENVEKATVSLPGKIEYYGGPGVKVTGKNTVEIDTVKVRTNILKNKVITDENGIEKIEPEVSVEDAGALIGYVIFDKDVSPFTVAAISVGIAAVIGFGVFVYKRVYISGKNILNEKKAVECKNEVAEEENGKNFG